MHYNLKYYNPDIDKTIENRYSYSELIQIIDRYKGRTEFIIRNLKGELLSRYELVELGALDNYELTLGE